MPDSFDFRWAILSDYSGQDEDGKLIIAGGYSEDIVFRGAPPPMWPTATMTICIAPKRAKFSVELALIRENGEPLTRVTGQLINEGEVGRRDRATLRIPFPQGPFPGAGTYIILLGEKDEPLEEVHRFEMVVTPE